MKKIKGILLLLSAVTLGTMFAVKGDCPVSAAYKQRQNAVSQLTDDVSSETAEKKTVQVGDDLTGRTIWLSVKNIAQIVGYGNSSLIDFEIDSSHSFDPESDSFGSATIEKSDISVTYMGYYRLFVPVMTISYSGVSSGCAYVESDSETRYMKDGEGTISGSNNYSLADQAIVSVSFISHDDIAFYQSETSIAYFAEEAPSFKVTSIAEGLTAFYEKPNVLTYEDKITRIYKNKSSLLTIDDVTKKMNFSGYKDFKITKDEYSGNGTKPGQYEIVYEAVDDLETHTISVEIVVSKDDLPSAIWTNPVYLGHFANEEYTISIDSNEQKALTREDIAQILSYTSDVNNEVVTYLFTDEDDALSKTNQSGVYSFDVRQKSSNGSSDIVYHVSLNVNDKDSGVVVDKRQSNWAKFCGFWINSFNRVKDFFVWIWDHTIGAIIDFASGK